MKSIILSILFFASAANCETFTCSFDNYGKGYACILAKITHLTDESVSITGTHMNENLDDNRVTQIFITDSNTKYVIPEVFTKFPNAKYFDIFNSKLNFVQPGAFKDGKNIISIKIYQGNNVTGKGTL
jgi:hypothetical protein